MIQLTFQFRTQVRGFFTLEEYVLNKSLRELEGLLGYQQGRLKQGADFYILDAPRSLDSFDNYGTTVFQGHKMEGSPLQAAINTDGRKEKDLKLFSRKRMIKVVPIQIHLEALGQYLAQEDYQVLRQLFDFRKSEAELLNDVRRLQGGTSTLVKQLSDLFARGADIYKKNSHLNDDLYPMAVQNGVPQWRLNTPVSAKLVCRITGYDAERYQRVD